MRGRGGMERIPGQDGEFSSADEEAETPAPLGEGPPLRSRVGAGLVTAVAIFGVATVALAYWGAPWHRAAAILGDHPQRQGQTGTRLFHSMEDLATHTTQQAYTGQQAYVGSREIYVENSDVFQVGDNIVILDPSGDSSLNEEGVVERVDRGRLTLTRPVSKSLADGSIVVVQAEATAPGAGSHFIPANRGANEDHPGYGEYDCDAGYANWEWDWSDNKKKACCQWENKGCSFDCKAGHAMWKSGWSEEKKKFCCYTEQKACESPHEDFHCDAGYDNWYAGWSENKQKVCCATEGKGCTFDCDAGYSLRAAGWSEEKKEFCCEYEQKSCGLSGRYDGGPWAVVMAIFLTLGIIACALALLIACYVAVRGNVQGVHGFVRACQNSLETLCNALATMCGSQRTFGSKGPSLGGKEWIFKPSDDRAIITLSLPEYDAPETGERLEPRERFLVSEEKVPKNDGFRTIDGGVVLQEAEADHGDTTFLKLADGRGWVLDREPGHEMCYRLFQPVMERWVYEPENEKAMLIREEPDTAAEKTSDTMYPGDSFVVSEIQADDDGVLFLRLADERGWVFDENPDGDVMCRRCLDETWEYRPMNGKPVSVRATPDVFGEMTTHKVFPEESFQVSEIEKGEDGVNYLRLEDGRGWLFDKHPQNGGMCYRVA